MRNIGVWIQFAGKSCCLFDPSVCDRFVLFGFRSQLYDDLFSFDFGLYLNCFCVKNWLSRSQLFVICSKSCHLFAIDLLHTGTRFIQELDVCDLFYFDSRSQFYAFVLMSIVCNLSVVCDLFKFVCECVLFRSWSQDRRSIPNNFDVFDSIWVAIDCADSRCNRLTFELQVVLIRIAIDWHLSCKSCWCFLCIAIIECCHRICELIIECSDCFSRSYSNPPCNHNKLTDLCLLCCRQMSDQIGRHKIVIELILELKSEDPNWDDLGDALCRSSLLDRGSFRLH